MKTTKILLIAFLGLALGISSCNKDDDDNNNNTNANTFFAKINGIDFNAQNISALKVGNAITITGSILEEDEIRFIIPSSITEGSYEFGNPFSNAVFGYYTISTNESFDGEAESGMLMITKMDLTNKKIEGTFNFIAISIDGNPTNTRNISDGSFKINLSGF